VTPLPDGEYPAMVLDCEDGVADDGTAVLHLELTLLTGATRGEVVSLTSSEVLGTFIDLMGMPATLTVRDGHPSVVIDR